MTSLPICDCQLPIADWTEAIGGFWKLQNSPITTMNAAELKPRTKAFAVRILELADALPARTSGRVAGTQIARSGCSVAANYRAACRGRSRAEFIAKLGIAEEEADETPLWLEIIEEAGLQPAQRLCELQREADELTAIFAASRLTARNRQSAIGNRQSP